MFNNSSVRLIEEDYFANNNYSKNIEYMTPTTEVMVNFSSNGLKAKKACFIYAEKLDLKGLVQLRVAEKSDHRKMYITTVDNASFQELKQEQSLHVTFSGFKENMVQILQDCKLGKLEICLVQDSRMNESNASTSIIPAYKLQFVEIRPFKNLVHLSLPCQLASLNVILFYMNNILEKLQRKCSHHEDRAQQLQHENHNHIRRIDQLDKECANLRENLLESTQALNHKHSEEILQLQENVQKLVEQRQEDSERHCRAIASTQAQLDKLQTEKCTLQAERIHEQKCNEILKEEISTLKGRIANLKEQNEKLHKEISILKNGERKADMHLQDFRKEVNDLKEILKKCDKNKAELVAELEAERKISYTKRQALEVASDEISKANQIIIKQTQEAVKLKKTITWRTEVAVQQEQAIKQKDELLKDKGEEIEFLKEVVDTLRKEIPKEIDSLRKFAKSLETKYSEQIEALKIKLQSPDKENRPSAKIGNIQSQ
ncbi:spindle assembly abnormal 6 isoform 1-T1 [Glossina fuscipes fuscipes]